MCVSTKEMSFFGDLICRPSSSCPRRSPFSAKARFACGRFAGAPLELTLPRFFPSRVVSRSICFVRSKQARTTSSSAPRFAAKRSYLTLAGKKVEPDRGWPPACVSEVELAWSQRRAATCSPSSSATAARGGGAQEPHLEAPSPSSAAPASASRMQP